MLLVAKGSILWLKDCIIILDSELKLSEDFTGSVNSANAIMKGWEVYYNFITKHQSLNCCPYELATDLILNSENKWLELIYNASQKS